MSTQQAQKVKLQPGHYIEAWHNGKLFHRGRVTDVVRSLELIWIRDARSGMRKLLDPEALEIVITQDPAAARQIAVPDSA